MVDGQRVPLDGKFDVGGYKMKFPGDMSAPAHLVYNCRCTTITVEPDYITKGEEPRLTYSEWESKKMKTSAPKTVSHITEPFDVANSKAYAKFVDGEPVGDDIEKLYAGDGGIIRGTRARTHELFEEASYTGLPEVVSQKDFETLIQNGQPRLWRGVDKQQYIDQMYTGKFFLGRGGYGHGTYASTSKSDATGYGSVFTSYTISKDAKVVTHEDLVRMLKSDLDVWYEKIADRSLSRDERYMYSDLRDYYEGDISRYAVNKGFDVIVIKGQGLNPDGTPADFYNVLNRSKIVYGGQS